MLINDEKIREISVDEYFYLTENLEPINNMTVQCGTAFLVYNKKRKLNYVVKKAIENELSNLEKLIAYDYFINNITANKIANTYHLSR